MIRLKKELTKLLLQPMELLLWDLIFLVFLILFCWSLERAFVRVIQSIGRGVRKAKDKDFVQIWDLTSTCKFAKRHLTQRKKFYKEAEYPFTIEKVDWN